MAVSGQPTDSEMPTVELTRSESVQRASYQLDINAFPCCKLEVDLVPPPGNANSYAKAATSLYIATFNLSSYPAMFFEKFTGLQFGAAQIIP
jgi:hypothetical protein